MDWHGLQACWRSRAPTIYDDDDHGPPVNIRTINTEADYREALREIETLMSAEAGTEAGERLKMLASLMEAYERKNFAMTGIENVRKSLRLDRILADQGREIVELDAKGEVVVCNPKAAGTIRPKP